MILPNIDPALSLLSPPLPAPSHAVTPPSEALTPTGLPLWPPEKQEEFYDDLCRLFVACNWAWNGVANPELLLFMSKYISQAKIPDRRVLSGHVLDQLVAQFEEKVRVEVSGKFVTGQCDGWKALSKAHIISTSSTVAGKVCLSPDAFILLSRAHNLHSYISPALTMSPQSGKQPTICSRS